MLVGITRAAEALGVGVQTLRRWDKMGVIPAFKTMGNHRRYDWDGLIAFRDMGKYNPNKTKHTGIAAIYVRVSSQAHKEDLLRQEDFLKARAKTDGYQSKKYLDIGSGLNDARPGLLRLMRDGVDQKYDRLYVTYLDRLARFGTRPLVAILAHCGIPVIVVHIPEDHPAEAVLTDDIVAIITSFAGKIHRRRRGQIMLNPSDSLEH